ncbi:transcription elongation factor [Sistotremastrum suecicum HHB10207 ss-3]|uniref:Transcription elongation factor n=1 Tax=Sistotremastrum suecicum HHB10207 ss-3 TaxID=1314776 RepID=A0A166DCJ9_9AGAM|nr:transcription elongation factor [Sistotremastrum suecicum HHB10207 ss-3]
MSDIAGDLKAKIKDLQAATSEPEITDILRNLKKNAVVTEKLLRDTKAGLAVGKLRQHSSKAVADLAKELVKKWKTEVEKEKASSGASSPAANGTKSSSTTPKAESARPTISTNSSSVATPASGGAKTPTTPGGPKSPDTKPRSAAADGVVFNHIGDRTRDKCCELVYDALASDSGAPVEQILSRARAIERKIFESHSGNVSAPYRTKMRSLYSNLKDKGNPGLRWSVVSGDTTVDKLCTMTSAEMASEERKRADEKIKQDNLFNSLAAGEAEAETDAFQCGRCKQRKTRYRQAQTRSADEPMTTFVTCVNCGNRWKFS